MPVLGMIVDSIGYRMSAILIMCFLLAGAHVQMLLMDDDSCVRCFGSYIPLVLYGICEAFHMCIFWPSVIYFAPEEIHGTAFGIMGCFENIGMSVFPPIISLIHENTFRNHGYFWVEVAFLVMCLILIALCI